MYDWSLLAARCRWSYSEFQLLLKGCTIEAADFSINAWHSAGFSCCWKDVRLKLYCKKNATRDDRSFSCCWKDVRLKPRAEAKRFAAECFSCCWKDVRLKHLRTMYIAAFWGFSCCWKDVRLKLTLKFDPTIPTMFQLLLKGCTIEALRLSAGSCRFLVSVVVERMYDWSCNSVRYGCFIRVVSVVVERMYDWSNPAKPSTSVI